MEEKADLIRGIMEEHCPDNYSSRLTGNTLLVTSYLAVSGTLLGLLTKVGGLEEIACLSGNIVIRFKLI